jgi:hypothetical protein
MGLLIIQTDDGIFLVDSEPSPHQAPRMLASGLIGLDGPPYAQFKMPTFKEHHNWNIEVMTPFSPFELGGTWSNGKGRDKPDDEDNWTAKGTGVGTGTGDDDEARAASATY